MSCMESICVQVAERHLRGTEEKRREEKRDGREKRESAKPHHKCACQIYLLNAGIDVTILICTHSTVSLNSLTSTPSHILSSLSSVLPSLSLSLSLLWTIAREWNIDPSVIISNSGFLTWEVVMELNAVTILSLSSDSLISILVSASLTTDGIQGRVRDDRGIMTILSSSYLHSLSFLIDLILPYIHQ